MPDLDFDLASTQTAAPDPHPGPAHSPAEPQPITVQKTAGPAPVQHTPGGLPAVPLAVITANSTVAGLSAAALTGGPVAALAAAGAVGAVAFTSAAVTRAGARKAGRKAAARRAATSSLAGGGRAAAGGRPGSQPAARKTAARKTAARKATGGMPASAIPRPRTGAPAKPAGRVSLAKNTKNAKAPSRPGTAAGKAAGHTTAGKKHTGNARAQAGKGAGKTSAPTTRAASARAGRAAGKLAGIKAARNARRAAGNTRKNLRENDTTARRRLADTRRNRKAAARADRLAAKGKAADTLKKPLEKAGKQAAKRDQARQGRDQRATNRVARIRQGRRRAAARMVRTRRLAWSAARFHARRLRAALLAAPVGLLGCLTTPLGRRLGAAALMYPGRRLYHRLTAVAMRHREDRDTGIRDAYTAALHADDTDTPQREVTDQVPRAPHNSSTGTPLTDPGDTDMSGFNFNDLCAELEAAAQQYDPHMMDVFRFVQTMAEGVESFANTFKILAERSDEEFPLDPQVGQAIQEVYSHLVLAIGAAGDVAKVFESVHEHDIARNEEPRNGLEAERRWNPGEDDGS